MKNRKIDTIISLVPFALAILVPVGRYVFGKVVAKDKQKDKETADKQKDKKE